MNIKFLVSIRVRHINLKPLITIVTGRVKKGGRTYGIYVTIPKCPCSIGAIEDAKEMITSRFKRVAKNHDSETN